MEFISALREADGESLDNRVATFRAWVWDGEFVTMITPELPILISFISNVGVREPTSDSTNVRKVVTDKFYRVRVRGDQDTW